jgi:phosphoribosylamine---glycine ligase
MRHHYHGDDPMKVLVVGSGGREHALAWQLGRDGVDVIVAPGNGGTPGAHSVLAADIDGLIDLAKQQRVDLTIVGPEAPLAAGLIDRFSAEGLVAFGPTRAAARLEWSKAWTKELLRRSGIPTASAEIVASEPAARHAVARLGLPTVLKADGLAGGKGVFVVTSNAELEDALDQLFRRRGLGDAADQVLIEERLEGPELSVLAFTDGERLATMPPARDYKRLSNQDRGPNTGGMGGYTWPSDASDALLREVQRSILEPTLAALQKAGHPYRGVLYAGLMLTRDGPKVLEFNCRFGDPECQLILPLLRSRLSDLCGAVVEGQLRPEDARWSERRTFGVVLAARGYPEAPQVGERIEGLEDLPGEILAFHAGTRVEAGRLVTAGGRVLTLVGFDRDAVYRAAESVDFSGKHLRRDIGVEVMSALGSAS